VNFTPMAIPGAWMIELTPNADERGYFARTFDRRAFLDRGLNADWPQCSVAYTRARGTIRGLHFQRAPHEEIKLIRCSKGDVFDVLVDLRPDSPAFGRHASVVLSEREHKMVYVPTGVAHGYQSLTDDTEMCYQITPEYVAEAAAGVRFDDPAFAIAWPLPVAVVSARDRAFADFAHDDRFAPVPHIR
jgi:dTDP-4-dehydrorhamnose 3,5-epimerase